MLANGGCARNKTVLPHSKDTETSPKQCVARHSRSKDNLRFVHSHFSFWKVTYLKHSAFFKKWNKCLQEAGLSNFTKGLSPFPVQWPLDMFPKVILALPIDPGLSCTNLSSHWGKQEKHWKWGSVSHTVGKCDNFKPSICRCCKHGEGLKGSDRAKPNQNFNCRETVKIVLFGVLWNCGIQSDWKHTSGLDWNIWVLFKFATKGNKNTNSNFWQQAGSLPRTDIFDFPFSLAVSMPVLCSAKPCFARLGQASRFSPTWLFALIRGFFTNWGHAQLKLNPNPLSPPHAPKLMSPCH